MNKKGKGQAVIAVTSRKGSRTRREDRVFKVLLH